ncbi:S-layer homology domain-containing protein [Paenibacillus sp. 1P07SE]|uniref:S-layer homology domain-containing protein n=1 Tax=Paenibacillus sp. 1P07SE TaxID=3132209 RepID=UPI0039A55156
MSIRAHSFKIMKLLLAFFVLVAIIEPLQTRMAQAAPQPPVLDWQITQQPAADFAAVVYGHDMFVGVGKTADASIEGTIQTSTDGLNWTERAWIGKGVNTALQAVAFGDGRFAAVGNRGTIMTSLDGLSWEDRSLEAFTGNLSSIAYGNGTFVAISGSLGGIRIVTSSDGENWTELPGPHPGHSSPRIVFGNGYFIILLGNQALTSTNGQTWTSITLNRTINANAVIYGGGQFLTVGNNGQIYMSVNGLEAWVPGMSNTSRTLTSVIYSENVYYATSSDGTFHSSTDGYFWTGGTDVTGVNLRGLAHGDGIVAAVGPYGISFTQTSSHVWTRNLASHPGRYNFNDVVYVSGRYLAVGQHATIAASTDGAGWTLIDSGIGHTDTHFESIRYADGLYIITGTRGTILISTDGIEWVQRPYTPFWTSGANILDKVIRIAYGNGVYVALVENSTSPARGMLTSTNGITWTRVLQPAPANLRDLTFGNGVFAAVGDGGTIITSADGEDWQTRAAGMTGNLRYVEAGAGKLLALTSDGKQVLVSEDGQVWRVASDAAGLPQSHTSVNAAKSLGYDNGRFIMSFQESASTHGLFYWSLDGLIWELSDSGRYAHFSGIAYGDSRYVAVGRYGVTAVTSAAPFVIGLEPSTSSVTVPLSGTEHFAITAVYSDGSRADVTGEAVFESADSAIADVENGQIVGRAVGTTSIKLTHQGFESVIAVEVTPVLSRLTLDPAQDTLPVGGTFQMNAYAVYSDDSSHLVTGDAGFASSDEAVAAVTRDGIVFGRSPGTATITVTYSGLQADAEVTVEALMSGIYLDSHKYNLEIGDTRQTVVTAVYSNGATEDVTAASTFVSLHPDIVSVDEDGEVTALSAGKGTIRVDYGTYSVQAVVDVLEPYEPPVRTVTGIRLDSNLYQLNTGDTRNTLVYADYSDQTNALVTDQATYVSSDTAVAEVSELGVVTARSPGSAVITVTFGGFSSTAEVTVNRPASSGGDGGGGGGGGFVGVVTPPSGVLTLAAHAAGIVSYDDKITVLVPAGAIAERITLRIQAVSPAADQQLEEQTLLSSMYNLTADKAVTFLKPATITLSFDAEKLGSRKPSVFHYDEASRAWVEMGGEVTGQTISLAVERLGRFVVAGIEVEVEEAESEQAPEPPAPEPQIPVMQDTTGHWAAADIQLALAGGWVSGYPDSTFRPDRTVNRAEFTVMLANALELSGAGPELGFTDRDQIGAWARDAVARAVAAGIVGGYADDSFRPNGTITRAEMAVMIARALNLPGDAAAAATGFADDEDIPYWAKSAIGQVHQLGIVNGVGENRFAPHKEATRAEAVAVLLRMLAVIR